MNADEARALAEANRLKKAKREHEEVIAELTKKIKENVSEGMTWAVATVHDKSALIKSGYSNKVIEHFENKGYTVNFSLNSLAEQATFRVSWE